MSERADLDRPVSSQEGVPDTDQVLRTRARALAEPLAEENAAARRRLITFTLGEERYALDVGWAKTILPLRDHVWIPVPGTPPFVVGVVNVRGRVTSVMDLGRYFGSEHSLADETAHVIIVDDGVGRMELGLLTDDVPEIVVLAGSEIEAVSEDAVRVSLNSIEGITPDLHLVVDIPALLRDPGIVVNVGG